MPEFPISGYRIAVIASRYNESICDRLVAGARQRLQIAGLTHDNIKVIRVPGAWELPLAVHWELSRANAPDAVVALGVVIQGETTHDEHINRFVTLELGNLSIRNSIPVGLGVLTCRDLQQAVERAGGKFGNKGEEAATAVLEMLELKYGNRRPAKECV